jgi:hypothetical protein
MKKTLIISSICLIATLFLFMITDPAQVPPAVLILPFLTLFITILAILALMFRWRGMSAGRSWRVGALCAAVPLSLLILQSIGQLTLRDILTVAALFLFSFFYISRTTTAS